MHLIQWVERAQSVAVVEMTNTADELYVLYAPERTIICWVFVCVYSFNIINMGQVIFWV